MAAVLSSPPPPQPQLTTQKCFNFQISCLGMLCNAITNELLDRQYTYYLPYLHSTISQGPAQTGAGRGQGACQISNLVLSPSFCYQVQLFLSEKPAMGGKEGRSRMICDAINRMEFFTTLILPSLLVLVTRLSILCDFPFSSVFLRPLRIESLLPVSASSFVLISSSPILLPETKIKIQTLPPQSHQIYIQVYTYPHHHVRTLHYSLGPQNLPPPPSAKSLPNAKTRG